MPNLDIGGQAVIEGVMMRSTDKVATAAKWIHEHMRNREVGFGYYVRANGEVRTFTETKEPCTQDLIEKHL